jgi:carbamoylphosphate synthase small subunit
VQKLNEPQAGIHVVLVDCGVETNSVKTLQISDIGKVFLVIPCH